MTNSLYRAFTLWIVTIGCLVGQAWGESLPVAGESATLGSALEVIHVCEGRLTSIFDYRCRIVRESTLSPTRTKEEEMVGKFRQQPASVYLRWKLPIDGQELIWVSGQNGDRMLTHGSRGEGSLDSIDRRAPLLASSFPVDGPAAHRLGLSGIVDRVKERWDYERRVGAEPLVSIQSAKVNDRGCFVVSVSHLGADDGRFTFHTTRVYVDREHLVPTRLEEYGYPQKPGPTPGQLLEAWTILDLHVNPGIPDEEFSISHPEYAFSKF